MQYGGTSGRRLGVVCPCVRLSASSEPQTNVRGRADQCVPVAAEREERGAVTVIASQDVEPKVQYHELLAPVS